MSAEYTKQYRSRETSARATELSNSNTENRDGKFTIGKR